jgi:type I restriction enzyme S subunit
LFYYYVFNSREQQESIRKSAIQTGVPHINLSILRNLPVQDPPLLEQEAIAYALSDADALIESLEQLLAKKRQIKQGAMQELLTGKRRLPGFGGQWRERSLNEVGDVLNGLTFDPRDVGPDGVLVLRSCNVVDGGISLDDTLYVQMDVPNDIMVQPGDILICVRNGSRDLIGKCAITDERCVGMTFGAFMAVLRTPDRQFMFQQLQSDTLKSQIAAHLGATINQITNKSLKSFQVPWPEDAAERLEIGRKLSEMDVEIRALEDKLVKLAAIEQGMMQELLTGRIRLVDAKTANDLQLVQSA